MKVDPVFKSLLGFFLQDSFSWLSAVICSALVSFFGMILLGSWFIRYAKINFRAIAREDTPDSHRTKDFTPTMGGACMVAVIVMTMALCGLWTVHAMLLLLTLISFCIIGAWDDWHKIYYRKGISERSKFLAQIVAAATIVALWVVITNPSTMLVIPLFDAWSFDLGKILYSLWAIWVILCTVNAVNFTDGLDGLATLTLGANFGVVVVIALLMGNIGNVVFLSAVMGTLLGFLWYNAYPAQIFMGDAGSLAFGAVLALSALMTKTELLIPIAGAIFVMEGVSVVAQMIYFKYTGQRLFKMAPIHHHFELMGCAETKITIRFFIVTLILCCVAFLIFLLGY